MCFFCVCVHILCLFSSLFSRVYDISSSHHQHQILLLLCSEEGLQPSLYRVSQNPARQKRRSYSKSSNTEKELFKIQQHRREGVPQNPARQKRRSYSKSSKTEKELFKIQQDRREGVIQNPARQKRRRYSKSSKTEEKELFKIQQDRERRSSSKSSSSMKCLERRCSRSHREQRESSRSECVFGGEEEQVYG